MKRPFEEIATQMRGEYETNQLTMTDTIEQAIALAVEGTIKFWAYENGVAFEGISPGVDAKIAKYMTELRKREGMTK